MACNLRTACAVAVCASTLSSIPPFDSRAYASQHLHRDIKTDHARSWRGMLRVVLLINPTCLVAVHCHPLRASAHLAVSSRADGSTAVALCAALLERQKLLCTERLVVNLRCRLDEVLQMGAKQEIPEINELAVVLVLNVNDTPSVLATADLLAVDNDRLLGPNHGKWNQILKVVSLSCGCQ